MTRAHPSVLVCSYQPLNPQLFFFFVFFPPGSTSFVEDDHYDDERIVNKKVKRGRQAARLELVECGFGRLK